MSFFGPQITQIITDFFVSNNQNPFKSFESVAKSINMDILF